MTFVVNPHTKEEEQELLQFLEQRNFDFSRDENTVLSKDQEQEILARDKEYEAGDAETFTLNEVIGYFKLPQR